MNLPSDISAYTFELPPELIAQEPSAQREAARLLVVRREPLAGLPRLEDLHVRELPALAAEEPTLRQALWVRNRTRVFPARFYARRASGGQHEIVLLREIAPGRWHALIRNQASLKPDQELRAGPENEQLLFTYESPETLNFGNFPLRAWLETHGEMPLPPYIKTRLPARDKERYQATWARSDKSGSAAAPTASLHFTPQLCQELEAGGARFADIILHVGLGTFAPLRESELARAELHSEEIEVESSTLAQLDNSTGARVAVGTTALRTLESLGLQGQAPHPQAHFDQNEYGLRGQTRLFVRPGFSPRYTHALFTNFHLPESTLFVLVSVFAGSVTLAQEAYRHAAQKNYRFFSFGDASIWL